MLIFMIFVMLAAERKAEMGMARAVGAQRSSLVQSFVSEGMAYNLIAGAVGAALGVARRARPGRRVPEDCRSATTSIHHAARHRALAGDQLLPRRRRLRSSPSSSRRSRSAPSTSSRRSAAPTRTARRERRGARSSWKLGAVGVPAMIVPPLGVWFFFRKGLGISWAWIVAPARGYRTRWLLLLAAKRRRHERVPVLGFGVSVLPLCVAMLAAHYRAPGRVIWTLVGAWLASYWLAPFSVRRSSPRHELSGDIEMFVLSGVMVVIAFTLIIVFNAKLLTTLFQRGNGHQLPQAGVLIARTRGGLRRGVVRGRPRRRPGQLLYLVRRRDRHRRRCGVGVGALPVDRRRRSRWASPTRSRTASAPA